MAVAVAAVLASALSWLVLTAPWSAASSDPGRVTSGRVWLAAMETGWKADSVLFTVAPDYPSRIDAFDRSSGRSIGHLDAGFSPTVGVRYSANELLVVHGAARLGDATVPVRLLILDIADGLSLKSEISLPERATSLSYTALMLSQDERFAYFPMRANRTDIEECRNGGNAAICDRLMLGVVDLNAKKVAGTIELPQGCIWVRVLPVAQGRVLAGCTGNSMVLDIDGLAVTRTVDLGAIAGVDPEPVVARNPLNLSMPVLLPGGEIGGLFQDGTVRWEGGNGEAKILHATPEGARVAVDGQAQQLADGRVFAVIRESFVSGTGVGYSILDLRTGESDVVQVPSGFRYGAMEREGNVLLLGEGSVERPGSSARAAAGVASDVWIIVK